MPPDRVMWVTMEILGTGAGAEMSSRQRFASIDANGQSPEVLASRQHIVHILKESFL
jgi:hypothetical protein